MVKKVNYSFLKYLNCYDLISKYNLKSIYLVPQVNKIGLKIVLDQSLSVKLKSHYKVFLFYYLYNFCYSKITLSFFTHLKKRSTTVLESKFFIDISYKVFFDFLISLVFLLNNKTVPLSYSTTSSSFNFISGKPYSQYSCLSFPVFTSLFFGKVNQNQQETDFNGLTVYFNFSANNLMVLPFNFFFVNNLNLYTNYFKNIFMFWSLKI